MAIGMRSWSREVALAALVLCLCCITPSMGKGRPKPEAGYVELHWYLQVLFNSSIFLVVPPLPGHGANSLFGALLVADQNATVTPDPTSTQIARVKGLVVGVNNNITTPGIGAEVLSTAVFNEASGYGGSTLSFQNFDDSSLPVRELAITGGTGHFRLARGWIDISLYSLDAQGLSAIKVDAYVYYGKYR